MPDLHLGLIGDNIRRSSSPRLHRLAGRQNGLEVQYDSLIPADLRKPFDQIFADCRAAGYRGLNITYPYKEIAAKSVKIEDPQVHRIGAVNTVVFDDRGVLGFNTDYSGFIAAYRAIRGTLPPGPTAMVGTGGVGRAVAFGLLTLGASEIRLLDCNPAKAHALAADLTEASPDTTIVVETQPEALAKGAKGLINCTPLGMDGNPGTVIPCAAMAGSEWVFDAVYTPVNTQFIQDAEAEHLQIISGYELFFFQGVNAWGYFSGLPLDQALLRDDLRQSQH